MAGRRQGCRKAGVWDFEYLGWNIVGAGRIVCMITCNHRPMLLLREENMLHLLAASALLEDLAQRFAIYLPNNFVFLYRIK